MFTPCVDEDIDVHDDASYERDRIDETIDEVIADLGEQVRSQDKEIEWQIERAARGHVNLLGTGLYQL